MGDKIYISGEDRSQERCKGESGGVTKLEDLVKISKTLSQEQRSELIELLYEFKDIFVTPDNPLRAGSVKIKPVDIDVGDSKPIFEPIRRFPAHIREEINRQVKKLLKMGVIVESRSPWSANVVLVRKPTKKVQYRLCVNLRLVNKAVKTEDSYPLPHITTFLNAISGAQFISVVDCSNSFFQIPLSEKAQNILSFSTEDGSWKFTSMPFGYKHASMIYQRAMESLVVGELKYRKVLPFIDDLCTFSKTWKEHLADLRVLFSRLRDKGYQLGAEKCQFGFKEIAYVGHLVGKNGIRPDPEKIIPFKKYPVPQTVKQVKSFLGAAGFFRKFIKSFAAVAEPLTRLTRKDIKWEWGVDQKDSFEKLKSALISKPILCHPDWDRDFYLEVDGSSISVGGQLTQRDDLGRTRVVCYLSKKLSDTQSRWKIVEIETYACIWCMDQLRQYITGKKFFLITDHMNIKWLHNVKGPSKLWRWRILMSEFDYEIIHKPGASNKVPDALSRVAIHNISGEESHSGKTELYLPSVDEFRESQRRDSFYGKIIKFLGGKINGDQKIYSFLREGKYFISGDTGLLMYTKGEEQPRIVVPPSMRYNLLKLFHDTETFGHNSRTKMYKKMSERFFYKGMLVDIGSYIRGCFLCKTIKSAPPFFQGYLELFPPSHVGQYVECDICGPFPRTVVGNVYVVVLCDRLSKWVEFIPTPDIRADTVADIIIENWIFRYGVMQILLTDRGSNFTSDLIKNVCKNMNIQLNHAMVLNHRSTGQVERIMKFITNYIAMFVEKSHTNWCSYIQSAAYVYRTSIIPSVGYTPAELTFGRKLNLPIDTLLGKYKEGSGDIDTYHKNLCEKLDRSVKNALSVQERTDNSKKLYHDRHQLDVKFNVDDLVLLYSEPKPTGGRAKKLMAKFTGPHRVIEVLSNLNYKIEEVKGGKQQIVHVRRLLKFDTYKNNMNSGDQKSGVDGDDETDSNSRVCVEINKILDKRVTAWGVEFLALYKNGIKKWVEPIWVPINLRREFERTDRQKRANRR